MVLPLHGGLSMKLKIILALLLTSCASNERYIIDPRVSKEPKEIIRDKLECRELAKPYILAKDQTFLGICTSKKCWRWQRNDGFDPIKQCLINRGHSILN